MHVERHEVETGRCTSRGLPLRKKMRQADARREARSRDRQMHVKRPTTRQEGWCHLPRPHLGCAAFSLSHVGGAVFPTSVPVVLSSFPSSGWLLLLLRDGYSGDGCRSK